ncbi:hypothetical protein L7F22_034730, partial [Adiantum nelumboides]|nr:hypothetical protein [Adiantum nelumboides]
EATGANLPNLSSNFNGLQQQMVGSREPQHQQSQVGRGQQGPVSGDEVGCTCELLKGISLQGQGGFGWPPECFLRIRLLVLRSSRDPVWTSSEHVVYFEWLALSVRVASREDMLVRVVHADATVHLVHVRGMKYSWFGFPDKKLGDQDSEECMQMLRLICGMRGKEDNFESYRGENHAVPRVHM